MNVDLKHGMMREIPSPSLSPCMWTFVLSANVRPLCANYKSIYIRQLGLHIQSK